MTQAQQMRDRYNELDGNLEAWFSEVVRASTDLDDGAGGPDDDTNCWARFPDGSELRFQVLPEDEDFHQEVVFTNDDPQTLDELLMEIDANGSYNPIVREHARRCIRRAYALGQVNAPDRMPEGARRIVANDEDEGTVTFKAVVVNDSAGQYAIYIGHADQSDNRIRLHGAKLRQRAGEALAHDLPFLAHQWYNRNYRR